MRSLLVLLALSAAATEAQVPVTPVDTVWVQPGARARGIAFSPDGAYVASGGSASAGSIPNTGRVALWAAADGAPVAEVNGSAMGAGRIGSTNGLVFSSGSDRLATAHGTVDCAPNGGCYAEFPQLALWTVPGLGLDVLRDFGSMIPTGLDLAPGGAQIAAGYTYDNAGAIRLHDPATLVSQVLLPGHQYATYGVRFSPDGSLLASVGDETVVRLWNAFTGALVRTLAVSTAPYFSERPVSLAFSPDGQTLAVGTDYFNTELLVFRVADGALLRRVDTRIEPVEGYEATTLVEVSPNGEYAVAAVSQEYRDAAQVFTTATRLRVYALATGEHVADYATGTWPDASGGFRDLALSPGQDHQIAYSLRGSLTVVDTTPLSMATPLIVAGAPTPSSTTALRLTGSNPFRTATTLALDVATTASVRAEAFDALGRRVAVLYDGPAAPGQSVALAVDAASWPAGVYTVRVTGAGAPLHAALTVVR